MNRPVFPSDGRPSPWVWTEEREAAPSFADIVQRHIASKDLIFGLTACGAPLPSEDEMGAAEKAFEDSEAQLIRAVEDILPAGVTFDMIKEALRD